MAELRLLAVSEDGTQLLLTGGGETYRLPIDDRLRAAVAGSGGRLGRMENEMDSQLRPRDIQARIRAGESAETVSEAAGIPLDRVRRYEGPVLAERAHIASLARATSVRRQGEGPSPSLGELVDELVPGPSFDREEPEWDAWRRDDGRWTVKVSYPVGEGHGVAQWVYDHTRRALTPDDDTAHRLVEGTGASSDEPFVPRLAAVPDPSGQQPVEAASADPSPAPAPAPETESHQSGTEGAATADDDTNTRPATRRAGRDRRSRRASVPSWDDIVFGSRRE
jgi:hypothetical protein